MILAITRSKNNVPIRLTDERWFHIILSHKEITSFTPLIRAIENPDAILKGDVDELLAVKKKAGKKAWIMVAYKEVNQTDGFVLTAYVTTDSHWLFKREVLWSKEL